MKSQLPIRYVRKSLPLVAAAMLGLTACSAEQAGDTNGGLVGGVGGISGTTALGVIGGVALAGLLLSSDDDDGSTANDGVGDGGGTGDDGTGDGGTGDDGTGDGGTGDDGTGDGGTGDDGTGDGGTGDDGTGDDGTGDDGTGDDGTGNAGTGNGGDTDPTPDETVAGTSTNTVGQGFLTDDGEFQEQLISANSVPAVTSSGTGDANLVFDRSTGQASGTVILTDVTADRVDLMVGPPGANGFVAVALENTGPNTWTLPTTLSTEQTMFILQNLNSGNLYVSASNDAYPDGEVRKQLLPGDVVQYSTGSVTGSNGATAEGYVLVNPTTGHYAITWNTSDDSLVSAHLNDNVIEGSANSNYVPLTQRTSNPRRFFLDGNYLDANDPLYPDLLTRLNSNMVWLDAHSVDDTRVFQDQVIAN